MDEQREAQFDKLRQLSQEHPEWGRMLLARHSGLPPATVQRWLDKQKMTPDELPGGRKRILEKIANSNLTDEELSSILTSSKVGGVSNAHTIEWGGESIRALVFSDCHIGAKVFRDDWWFSMWDAAVKYGAEICLFGGDFLEGPPVRPGHIYECSEIGWNAQKDKALSLLEDIPLQINGVMGNHDLWYMQRGNSGINPGRELMAQSDKFNWLGDHFADITVGGLDVRLHHGLDGASYALGYRSQKIIEAIPGGEKPHVLITGHDHKQGHFDYRNVQAIAAGTLCPQTKWMQGKRIQAACGFYIVDLEWNDAGLESISPRWFPLYS
jgi:predicted phosphodiesterase